MKKNLLSLTTILLSFAGTTAYGQASCTPNLSCLPSGATQGICPDSATGIPAGVLNVAYNTTMSIKIPSTTTYMGTTINLTHFAVSDVSVDTTTGSTGTYVPLSAIGLNYLGSGSNTPSGTTGPSGVTMTQYCYWTAPNNACVIVSGTPNKSGTFPVRIQSYVRASALGSGFWQPAPDNNDYKLLITPVAGIENLTTFKFDVLQNNPNPFSNITTINFTSPKTGDLDLKVFNLLGAVVFSKTIRAEKGLNEYELDGGVFTPGIYMYSIKNGDKTITKRMIVSSK